MSVYTTFVLCIIAERLSVRDPNPAACSCFVMCVYQSRLGILSGAMEKLACVLARDNVHDPTTKNSATGSWRGYKRGCKGKRKESFTVLVWWILCTIALYQALPPGIHSVQISASCSNA